MAAGLGGLVWTLLVFGVLARLASRELKFIDKYIDPEDLGYYTSTHYTFQQQYSDYVLKNFCPDPVAKHKHKMADKKCAIKVSNFYQCGFTVIIILYGDIAQNPGPIKHPCGLCHKPVRNNQRAIQCEDCFFWHHIKCINMTVKEYNDLSYSWESWFCRTCILPSFTDSFFDMSLNENNNEKTADTSLRSSDTEFSNTESSECRTSQQNVNIVDETGDIFERLVKLRKDAPDNIICAYLNINTLTVIDINMNIS